MDVFLMIKRKNTTIFLDAKEDTTVYEVKKMVEGITKVPPENQELYKNNEVMEPHKTLGDYDLKCSTAKVEDPALVGLAYKDNETLEFESLEITPLSIPPELPDVMKPREPNSDEASTA